MPSLLPGKPIHLSQDTSSASFSLAISRLKELTRAATPADSYFMVRTVVDDVARFVVVHKPRRTH